MLQNHKWDNAGWLELFVICVIALIYLVKEKRLKSWLLFLPIFSVIIIYNPIFAKITYGRIFPTYLEYERLTWVMGIPILMAAVLAETVGGLTKKVNRKVFIAIGLVFTLMSQVANPLMKQGNFADNVYKLTSEVYTIADELVRDVESEQYDISLEKSDRTSIDNRPVVLVQADTDIGSKDGNEIYYGIRQYTALVKLDQRTIPPSAYNAETFNLAGWQIEGCQYFICVNNDTLRDQAEQLGFELLEETENYLLFKNVKELTLYFVRHGQTDANISNILAGSGTDAMLTDEGKSQALATGEALSGVDFASVYTSEMTRTKDTANLILSENTEKSDSLSVTSLTNLNDINWGDVEGLSAGEVVSRYPDFSEEKYLGDVSDSSFVSPISAESKYTVVRRINYAIYCQVIASSSTGDNVLVVGHSSMQWWLQKVLNDSSIEGLNNASITVIKYNRGTWEVECINSSAEDYEVANE